MHNLELFMVQLITLKLNYLVLPLMYQRLIFYLHILTFIASKKIHLYHCLSHFNIADYKNYKECKIELAVSCISHVIFTNTHLLNATIKGMQKKWKY